MKHVDILCFLMLIVQKRTHIYIRIILLMEEMLHQLVYGSFHYNFVIVQLLQCFFHPQLMFPVWQHRPKNSPTVQPSLKLGCLQRVASGVSRPWPKTKRLRKGTATWNPKQHSKVICIYAGHCWLAMHENHETASARGYQKLRNKQAKIGRIALNHRICLIL